MHKKWLTRKIKELAYGYKKRTTTTLDELIYFSIFVAGGIIVGILFQRLITPMVKRVVSRTRWLTDDLITDSTSRWVIPWFIALGVYLGWQRVEMLPKYHLWLERAIFVFYTFSITWILARVLSGMTRIKSNDSQAAAVSSSIISNIIKVIVYCIGILVVLQFFGISITPILAGLGVGGLAVALALQDTLSNLFCRDTDHFYQENEYRRFCSALNRGRRDLLKISAGDILP